MNPGILPVIPETVTVHLGPPDAPAQNITVSFPDYIKNVASGEIYPTWPQEALRANIYAQITYALNRIYTEYYRARGYDFDITSSTGIDQSFVNGRDYFENISEIVDEIFNSYIRRQDRVEPIFAAFCDGIRTQCQGLSQWGSVDLANQGLSAFDILRRYYGDDIELVQNVPIENAPESYPGAPLAPGTSGNDVRLIQLRLNRISSNYPAIPKIYPTDGVFGQETENAVKAFQRIFNLTPDGIVGKATWYRILYLYTGIKRLSELVSEGLSYADVDRQLAELLSLGDQGSDVSALQYFLSLIGQYLDAIPQINITGIYDQATENAVRAFQEAYGLEVTGITTIRDWRQIYRAYEGIVESLPDYLFSEGARPFPGVPLRVGSRGEDVKDLQEYLNTISESFPQIPKLDPDGIFGNKTSEAVVAYQNLFGLNPSGTVGIVAWNSIADLYNDIVGGYNRSAGQYPGYTLEEDG